MQKLLSAKPVEKFTGVGRLKNFPQGVVLFEALDVVPCRQQVQVMVAQHAGQRFADGIEKTQGFQ
ncbi:hypothetical protein D3C71_2190160 [compost metagenome]